MPKIFFSLSIFLLFTSCSDKKEEKQVVTDDNVLIEFAARLEEDKQSTLIKPKANDASR